MASPKLDVLWSPVHNDKFIVWGSDITLYEVARLKEIDKKTNYTQISATRAATPVACQSGAGVRSLDIAPLAEPPEPLLALGHASGRVQLAALRQATDPLRLSGREFVPRYPRPCNAVSWSPVEPHLLAVGMDKHRTEHCLLLWDVTRGALPAREPGPASMVPPEPPKPLAEMVLSEPVHSVAWSACAPRTLLASTNLKYIKIFDLRDLSNKAVNMTTSRYCYGACFDPWSGWQVASRGEHVVCLWDVRAFERPLLVLPQPRPVLRVMWCPTRRNLILSLPRDSSSVRLHSLQAAGDGERGEGGSGASNADSQSSAPMAVEAELEEQYLRGPSVIERDVAPGGGAPGPGVPTTGAPGSAGPGFAPIAACCWHPAHEARLLAVYPNGSIVEHTVTERVTVSWGAGGLVWGGGADGGALRTLPCARYSHVEDISHLIRRRAHTDYGLKPDLWQNADLADDEALSGLWHFLALSKSLVEDGCIRNSGSRHPGVRSVLRSPAEGYRSEMVPSLLPDLPSRRVTVYRSVERTLALQLCGWGWGWENAGAGVERLEAEGTPCRAAALAAFHLRLRAAIDVLARANEPQLRVVALALAGLSEERLWREAVSAAAQALPDAYLRALLHFLAASSPAAVHHHHHQPDYSAVLNETEMRLEDRVAFACIFLSDSMLHEYVKRSTEQLAAQGDLSGMLLTGASAEGVTLLQRWLETSGDVQTAALVAARCFTPDLLKEPRVCEWLHSYRNILDAWRMWWARCALDTWCAGSSGTGGAAPTAGGGAAAAGAGAPLGGGRVAVACTYCGKPVAAPLSQQRQRPAFARLPPPAAKMKISSCPNCRKPLPRCGVCGLHLGTAGGAGGGARFRHWFSWCGACSHAGHAHHLIEWFKDHTECPVSNCHCHCAALDPPDVGTPPDRRP